MNLAGPLIAKTLEQNREREAQRLAIFERAWDATKDPKMRVALAVAFLEGGAKS